MRFVIKERGHVAILKIENFENQLYYAKFFSLLILKNKIATVCSLF
jgi:hypothetical protein